MHYHGLLIQRLISKSCIGVDISQQIYGLLIRFLRLIFHVLALYRLKILPLFPQLALIESNLASQWLSLLKFWLNVSRYAPTRCKQQ